MIHACPHCKEDSITNWSRSKEYVFAPIVCALCGGYSTSSSHQNAIDNLSILFIIVVVIFNSFWSYLLLFFSIFANAIYKHINYPLVQTDNLGYRKELRLNIFYIALLLFLAVLLWHLMS